MKTRKYNLLFKFFLIHDDESNEIDEMEVEDLDLDIDQLDDAPSSNFLNRSEYHYAKNVDYQEKDNFEQVSYILDIFQAIQQKTYCLGSRIKQASQDEQKTRNVPRK